MPTITASTNGGYVLANNQSSHANARNAASGNVIVTQASRVSTSLSYVRAAGRGGSTVYAIYRSFLQFDTSGITGTVSSATLKIYGYINGTADLKIVKSTAFGSGYEGSSLSTADYDALPGHTDNQAMDVSFSYSSEIATWSTSGYNNITLNSTALTDMQNDDAFKIALINHDHDYKNVDPGIAASNLGGMYFTAYSGTSTDPVIEYTLSGYGNNVIGVASADIAKVNGVATGDIEKIIGI